MGLTYKADWHFSSFDLWGLLRQILMAFCPVLTYGANWGRFWWHFAPFSLTGPMAACFDGILPPFAFWGPLGQIVDGILPCFDLLCPYRRILMAFCPVLTYEAQICRFDGIFPHFTYGAHTGRFCWHFAPFWLMRPDRQILMAFFLILTYWGQ